MLDRLRIPPVPLVLFVAILLRIIGVWLNQDANDPHMPVVQIIAYEHRIPADDEAWEAFQPKLYYLAVAAVLQALPALSEVAQTRVAQGVSAAAGIATLLIILDFLKALPVSQRVREITFALAALNPKMIATSIQATNDAFVILFVTLALAAGYRFFRDYDWRHFTIMSIAVLLACVAKGNGLIAAIAIACTFVAAMLRTDIPRLRLIGFGLVLLVAFSLFVVPLGGYWSRAQAGGSPFTINQDLAEPPELLRETYAYGKRAGITSLVHGYATFRLADLLHYPVINNESSNYPRHRTSFWTLLYGSAHSIHYDFWPATWASADRHVRWLLRAITLLALLPTAVLVFGMLSRMFGTLVRFARGATSRDYAPETLLAVTMLGYLGFVALYGYQYRDYANMKPIFLYPAVLALTASFAAALQRLEVSGSPLLFRLTCASAALLCAGYVADVLALYAQLALQL